ncbi:MAG: transposase [Planctomycetaceae bacterium]|nr:transposase [Planctomycetaceae bacterium]
MLDELLAREQFETLLEAKVFIQRWRRRFNAIRPHKSLGYRASAPETIQPAGVRTSSTLTY